MDSTLLDLFKTKYERGAKTPDTHDCKSLTVEVLHRFGIPIKTEDIGVLAVEEVISAMARNEYPYSECDAAIIEKELSNGQWEKIDVPEKGCVVAMALDPMHHDLIQHLGVYIGENKFIQILEDTGVTTTNVNDRFFKRKIRGFYKWKDS